MLTIQVPNSKVGLGNHKDVRMLRVNSITIGALVQRNHRSKLYCFEHRSIYIAIVYTYIYIYISWQTCLTSISVRAGLAGHVHTI